MDMAQKSTFHLGAVLLTAALIGVTASGCSGILTVDEADLFGCSEQRPEGDCPEPEPSPTDSPDFDAVERDLAERWRRARLRSYATTTVTGEDDRTLAWQDSKEAATGRGADYGQLVHRLLEQTVNRHLPEDAESYIRACARRERQGPENAAHAIEALDRFEASEIWQEIQASKQTYTEVDFAEARTFMGQTEIARGRIDLVYRVPGGWKIVDFKTDRAGSPSEIETLRKRYGHQVRAYVRYWTGLGGERVRSAGLWATDPGVWIEI